MKSERKTVNYEMTMKNMKRENLLEKLRKEGRFVENPCNGKGICGKCKVKILSGDAGKVTETERRFLSEEELARGIRLSCMVYPEEELEVETFKEEKKTEVLSEGYVPEFEKHTELKKQIDPYQKTESERPDIHGRSAFDSVGKCRDSIFVATASGISRRDLYGSHLVREKPYGT